MESNSSKDKKPSPSTALKSGLGKLLVRESSTGIFESFTGMKGTVKELSSTLTPLKNTTEKLYGKSELADGVEAPKGYASIWGIVLAGDSAVAIVRQMVDGQSSPLVKFVELPWGEHSSLSPKTGRVIATINPSTFNKPRADGVVQSYETLRFGRSKEDGFNCIGQDLDMSRNHFEVAIGDGDISVTDHSTNGTYLITEQAIWDGGDNPLLMTLHQRILDPSFQKEWNTDYDKHVTEINPYATQD